MLHRLEVKSEYSFTIGRSIIRQDEEFVYKHLTKTVAEQEYRYHLMRPNATNIRLYKLSLTGYKLIKEYDRERATKENDRMGFTVR